MASMAVVAKTSSLFVATTATVYPSSVSRTRSGLGSSCSPLVPLKRSFNGGQALRASRLGNAARRSVDSLVVRATSSPEETAEKANKQLDEIISDLKIKWEAVENKPTVAIYAGGAVLTLWFSSVIIGAVNSVPLLPKLLELVGLGYTGWFVYRYLLFKSSRKELLEDVEELKTKITGSMKGKGGESVMTEEI
ncbi:unnamed protein product [Calypogeia fissa]